MTNRTMVVLAATLCGCGPNYQAGKTECSDKYDCPSGYACSSVQKGATPVCYRVDSPPCDKANPFYCSWAQPPICAPSPAQCPDAVATGGSGGGGGTGPSSCTTPEFPLYCPASGGVEASCWESRTDCSTIVSCGLDDIGACSSGRKVYCAASDDNRCCVPPAVGGTCNIPACGCPAGQVCYPNTKATGLTCVASTGLTDGTTCLGKTDVCAEGLGCFGGMCSPYCETVSDCPTVDGARACDQTYWDKDQPIDGVSVCSRVCDPVTPQKPRSPLLACPVGFGCAAGDSNPGASDCIRQAGTLTAGATCSTTSDCAPGHYCSTGSLCYKYCYTSADCPTGSSCGFFASPRYAGTAQVGACE